MVRAEELVTVAFDAGAVDLLVVRVSIESGPAWQHYSSAPACVERDAYIALTRAGDRDSLTSMGSSIAGSLDPRLALSTREREVYDLVCDGSVES